MHGVRDWFPYKGAIEYVEPTRGWTVRIEHQEYIQAIEIERRFLDDNKYREITNVVGMMGMSAARTREKHAASVFNNAFSSSYTGGDGKALSATDHPYSPDNAGTQSNKGTLALNATNIGTTIGLMRALKGGSGEHLNIMPDTVLVPPALESAAYVALNTPLAVGSANNDLNYLASQRYRVIVWKYLEDTTDWYLIDSSLMRRSLYWFERVPIEFTVDPKSVYELKMRTRGYMRYSFGWTDWRWIYGNEVAGG
jgi:phage major head subunit gpT-like protein